MRTSNTEQPSGFAQVHQALVTIFTLATIGLSGLLAMRLFAM